MRSWPPAICSGPRRGTQFTYALVDDHVPAVAPLTRDAALAALATRYFRSHGPATVHDFSWWSGLTITDARAATAGRRGRPAGPPRAPPPRSPPTTAPPTPNSSSAYRHRDAVLDPARAPRTSAEFPSPKPHQREAAPPRETPPAPPRHTPPPRAAERHHLAVYPKQATRRGGGVPPWPLSNVRFAYQTDHACVVRPPARGAAAFLE